MFGSKSVTVIPMAWLPVTFTTSVYTSGSPDCAVISDTCLAKVTLLLGVGVIVNVLVKVLVQVWVMVIVFVSVGVFVGVFVAVFVRVFVAVQVKVFVQV